MKRRIISGVLMLPLFFVVFIGGKVLLFGCFVIGVLGVREFFNGFRAAGVHPCGYIAYAAAAALYAINLAGGRAEWYMMWFASVVAAGILYLFNTEKRAPADGTATITGIFYVIFLSYHVPLAEQTGAFSMMVWLIFISAFGTDITAYFIGSAIGKRKLCPKISPKKTVAGAVGGIIGSVALCGVFGYFLTDGLFIDCLIIGAAGGVLSQLGDLSASVFKRKLGIKDYGTLIPGHGGVLDRFDSVLFTAPLVYYYIELVLI